MPKPQIKAVKEHGTEVSGKQRKAYPNTKSLLPEAPELCPSTGSRRSRRLMGQAVEDFLTPAASTSPKLFMKQTASVVEANGKALGHTATESIPSDYRKPIARRVPTKARTDPSHNTPSRSKRVLATEEDSEASIGKRRKVHKSPSRSTPQTQSELDNEEELDLEEVLQFIRDAQEQRRNKFGVSGMAYYAVYETRNGLPPSPDDMKID